jgi:type IV pilus assembly protein PilV
MSSKMKHSRGFTLIEVLVAVLVLSVGLLGLAGLQATSLRSNHSAYLRTQALILTYDLIDRMRANRDVAVSSNAYLTEFDEPPETVTNCQDPAANCTAQSMAIFDINQWKCMLGGWDSNSFCDTTLNINGALPGGVGSVSRDADNLFTIQVRYNERQGALNADTTTIEVRAQL